MEEIYHIQHSGINKTMSNWEKIHANSCICMTSLQCSNSLTGGMSILFLGMEEKNSKAIQMEMVVFGSTVLQQDGQ